MAPGALDNANPTVLSASQLPSRQKKAVARKGPDSKYTDVIFAKPSFLSRPFCDDDSFWPRGDIGEEDYAAEPIDEQEIYGTCFPPLPFPSLPFPYPSPTLPIPDRRVIPPLHDDTPSHQPSEGPLGTDSLFRPLHNTQRTTRLTIAPL